MAWSVPSAPIGMTGLVGRRRLERAPVGNLRCLAQQAGFCAVAVACGGGEKDEGMVAPMSVMKRVSMIFRAKANKALDKMEDPRETLDYSYQTQLELLQKVRRGVADVATSRKRVELQINQLQQSSDKLDRQARDALAVGREDLARDALTRKAGVQSQLSELNVQYTSLQGEEEKLTGASQRLQAKVESFRTKKETIKATYTAAEAQTRINEAFTGISEEMGDVGLAIQRAEDKTEQMKARASAIDELMASGALDDMVGGPRDDIQAELDRMGAGSGVEAELERLKGELGQGGAPREIEGSGPAADGAAAGTAASAADGRPAQASPADQPRAGDGT
jgi:phage shock protein A